MTYDPELLDKAKRHPEKQKNPDRPMGKKPSWIRVRAPQGAVYQDTREIVHKFKLNTVCEEAGCPNIGECWQKKHATFLIMGEVCTRACSFCNIATGKPKELDKMEPLRVGVAVEKMALKHVVVTSVDRDDLEDGGADHYVKTIGAIRYKSPGTTIEILTGDFRGDSAAIDAVTRAKPDVFNHNMETVPRLYREVRPGASYEGSLKLLRDFGQRFPGVPTKTGLMLGLGETEAEVIEVMRDLRAHGCDLLTLGQYLRPSPAHLPVIEYITPERFAALRDIALGMGFSEVAAGPLVRSSYRADVLHAAHENNG